MDAKKIGFALALIMPLVLASLFATSVIAPAPPQTVGTTATVTVNQFISLTLTSGSPVTFGSMDPNIVKSATNDPLVVTVGSETNVVYDITTIADNANFTSGANTFAVGSMTWSPDNSTRTAYSSTVAGVVYDEQVTTGAKNIYHQITVPSNQAAGAYSVAITVTARVD